MKIISNNTADIAIFYLDAISIFRDAPPSRLDV